MSARGLVWLNGRVVSAAEARVSVLAHSLHYGTAVFEGMRVYDTPRGPAVFRHTDHLTRLLNSARMCFMEVPWGADELRRATEDLVTRSGFRSCYVRPLVFRGEGTMNVSPLMAEVEVAIAVWPWETYLGDAGKRAGIRATVSSWRRLSIDAVMTQAKVSGHYINSALAKVEAELAGHDEAILLDSRGMVSEGSGENVFIVHGERIATPGMSSAVLPGITRRSVIELARALGFEVAERDVERTELLTADEVFMTGTAAELTPVREIDGHDVGTGAPGPVTLRLQRELDQAFHGLSERFAHWSEPVAAGAGSAHHAVAEPSA